MIVVDTNVIAYLMIPGDYTAQARAALWKDPQWAAPLLWRSEFNNVLALYMRHEEFSCGKAVELARKATALPMSSASPTRPQGISSRSTWAIASSLISPVLPGVPTHPGSMAFTRILYGASSIPSVAAN